jgi:hyaluronoglucosaminidase
MAPDGRIAYVIDIGRGVTPIRTATNTPLKLIKDTDAFFAIAITPDGKTVYVTNPDDGTVTPIRTATGTALKPVKVAFDPVAMAITP